MNGFLQVVVGGQAGSEGKGAIAGYLAQPEHATGLVTAVRVGGSQAGHTVYGRCPTELTVTTPLGRTTDLGAGCPDCTKHGHPWRLRHIPVAMVTNPQAHGVIAAGSEIDPAVLRSEILRLETAGYKIRDRLIIDEQATIITQEHVDAEQANGLTDRLGSTAKGVGAARADRIWRTAGRACDLQDPPCPVLDTGRLLRSDLSHGGMVQIEGVQGHALGLHAGHYPYCTSSDCRAIDFLAMAGLSPWARYIARFEVWVVARIYPIRVAGNSGPLRNETTWEELGLQPELTTVTKKTRRVGAWDPNMVAQAIDENGGAGAVRVALTMLDQRHPEIAGAVHWRDLSDNAIRTVMDVQADVGAEVQLVGTGPRSVAPQWNLKQWSS